MAVLQRKLMLKEANSRLAAAQSLRRSGDGSDSAYLLDLLGFELLLKLLVLEKTGRPAPWHHRYDEVFGLLPSEVRQELLDLAAECIGLSELAVDHAVVLRRLGSNFVALRYPFQSYSGLSEEQYRKLGCEWIEDGAPDSSADFLYFPEELFGLISATKKMVEESFSLEGPS